MDYQSLDEEKLKQQHEAGCERDRQETTSGRKIVIEILNEIIELRGCQLSDCTFRVYRNNSSPDFEEIVDSTGMVIARLKYELVRDVPHDPDGLVRKKIKSLLETQLGHPYRM